MGERVGLEGRLQASPRCSARVKSGAARCGNPAVRGAGVCRLHGGSAPQVRASARRRLLEVDLAVTLRGTEWEAMRDPVEALQVLGGQAVAVKDWAMMRVAELEDAGGGSVEVAAIARVWGEWSDRAVKVGVALAGLGLEERRVRLDEREVDVLAALVHALLDRLGLTGAARDDALEWIAGELRTLGSGAG